jgi:hypothetical protein
MFEAVLDQLANGLLTDEEAVRFAEEFCKNHGTTYTDCQSEDWPTEE